MTTRTPAPGGLDLVQRFVNTLDVEQDEDTFKTPADLAAFLIQERLLAEGVIPTGEDLERTVRVREALRAMMHANHGVPLEAGAVETLNAQATRSGLFLSFADDGTSTLRPKRDGVDAALGELLALVHAAMDQGTWERMKACKRGSCQWAFYDRSKNHSSKWCSMEVCGNREKAQTYRRRRKQGA